MQAAKLRLSIASHIMKTTVVEDPDIGYIVCKEVNKKPNPALLLGCAKIVKTSFVDLLPAEMKPSIVIGVPSNGKKFAEVLGKVLKLPVIDATRTKSHQTDEYDASFDEASGVATIPGIISFTHDGNAFDHYIDLKGMSRDHTVLIADDFAARGTVTEHYLRGLEHLGFKSLFVFMVAKDFPHLNPPQTGYRTHRENGVPAFAVVRVTDMIDGKGGNVVTTVQDI